MDKPMVSEAETLNGAIEGAGELRPGPDPVSRPAGRGPGNPPVRVRLAMTLSAWLVAFAVVMALLALFGDLLAALPMAGRAAVISGVLVTVMVNLVMPRLAALVNRWAAR